MAYCEDEVKFVKKIFYYTDVLPFLGKDNAALQKLERNLEIFKAASDDVRLVWHPFYKTEEYLELNNSWVLSSYRKIVEQYRSENWGDFDEAEGYQAAKEVLLSCDAYYGDVSNFGYEAQLAGIPVMFQNFDI